MFRKGKRKKIVLCSRTKLGSLQEMYKKAGSTFELFAFAGINLLLFFLPFSLLKLPIDVIQKFYYHAKVTSLLSTEGSIYYRLLERGRDFQISS